VIAVGNEFGSVEALWSRFEEVTEEQNNGAVHAEKDNERMEIRQGNVPAYGEGDSTLSNEVSVVGQGEQTVRTNRS